MSGSPFSFLERVRLAFSARAKVIALIVVAGACCYSALELSISDLIPNQGGWEKIKQFFAAATSPALEYEDEVPPGTPSILLKIIEASIQTVAFATTAISLSILVGFGLALMSSSQWWGLGNARGRPQSRRKLVWARLGLMWICRSICVLLRSIHELIWAVLLLSAFGLNHIAAILAIAIPYAGVFGKMFSETIDETPPDSANALQFAGASGLSVFFFGLFPRALPDLAAYTCYRFECAVRSAAVMGFFGVPTLGYYLKPAFEEQHFHEAWAYLYSMLILIVCIDSVSGRIRRRLVQ